MHEEEVGHEGGACMRRRWTTSRCMHEEVGEKLAMATEPTNKSMTKVTKVKGAWEQLQWWCGWKRTTRRRR
jgi:hypothetical protein